MANTTYYVINGNASIPDNGAFVVVPGDNSNDGLTPITPKKDFSNLISTYTLVESDTVNLAGTHLGAHTCIAQTQQWVGQTQAKIWASIPAKAGGGSWLVTGTTWRINIGVGKVLGNTGSDRGNVCCNWNARVDAAGRHYGWYKSIQTAGGSRAANELSVDKTFDYDGASGLLYIRDTALFTGGVTPATIDAAGEEMNWVRYVEQIATHVGLDQHNTTNPTRCEGIWFGHFVTRAGQAYGYWGGSACYVRNCKAWDCDVHHFTISHNPMNAARIEECEMWGLGTTNGANVCVFHNPAGDVSGCRGVRLTAHVYALLDPDGVPHSSSIGLVGLFAHALAGSGHTVEDVEWEDCNVTLYENPGLYYSGNDTRTTVSNVDTYADYAIKVTGGVCRGVSDTHSLSINIAFRRVLFDMQATANRAVMSIANICGFAVTSGWKHLFESCVIIAKTTAPSDAQDRYILRFQTGSLMSFVNTVIIDTATAASTRVHLFASYQSGLAYVEGSAGFQFRSKGCVYYMKTNYGSNGRISFGDAATSIANMVHDGNWWYGIGATLTFFAGNDTSAEWLSTIDSHAVFVTNPLFQDDTAVSRLLSGKPAVGSPLLTTKFAPVVHTTMGFNGQPYASQYGAWQQNSGGMFGSMIGGAFAFAARWLWNN